MVEDIWVSSGNGVIAATIHATGLCLLTMQNPVIIFPLPYLASTGLLGMIPDNYIWVRNAVVDFYKDGLPTNAAWKNIGKIYVIDTEFESYYSIRNNIDKVADGFSFTEGPVVAPRWLFIIQRSKYEYYLPL